MIVCHKNIQIRFFISNVMNMLQFCSKYYKTTKSKPTVCYVIEIRTKYAIRPTKNKQGVPFMIGIFKN